LSDNLNSDTKIAFYLQLKKYIRKNKI